MKQIIASIALAASFVGATPVSAQEYAFRNVHTQDALYTSMFGKSVTNGVLDRSLQPRVDMVHTDHKAVPMIRFEASYKANMCVLERMHCQSAQLTGGKDATKCMQFTALWTDCNVGTIREVQ